MIGELLKDKQLNFVACGLKSAYVSKNAPEAFVALMAKHYHRLQPVNDYHDIDDILFKFSLNLPDEQIPLVIDKLHVSLDGIMKPVTSGFGFIDLIIPGLHKANGISRLLKRWNRSPQNVVAIGDSGNDAEMLKMAHYSLPWAMPQTISKRFHVITLMIITIKARSTSFRPCLTAPILLINRPAQAC